MPAKRTGAKKSGKRKGKARRAPAAASWYESNWFLLLLVAVVIAGVSWWRAPRERTATDEPPVAADAEIATAAPAPEAVDEAANETAARTLDINGTVTYRGLLTDEVVVPTVDRHVCEEHVAGSLKVADGQLADVLVWLEGAEESDTRPAGASLEVSACSFSAAALVLGLGAPLRLSSSDAVPHPIESEGAHVAALNANTPKAEHRFDSTGLKRLACARHPWEQAHVLVVDHAHATVTDSDGRFVLQGVPLPTGGTVSLQLFHPELGTFERSVDAEAGRPLELEIDLTERIR